MALSYQVLRLRRRNLLLLLHRVVIFTVGRQSRIATSRRRDVASHFTFRAYCRCRIPALKRWRTAHRQRHLGRATRELGPFLRALDRWTHAQVGLSRIRCAAVRIPNCSVLVAYFLLVLLLFLLLEEELLVVVELSHSDPLSWRQGCLPPHQRVRLSPLPIAPIAPPVIINSPATNTSTSIATILRSGGWEYILIRQTQIKLLLLIKETTLKSLIIFVQQILKIVLVALLKVVLAHRLNRLLISHVSPRANRRVVCALVRLQIRNAQV